MATDRYRVVVAMLDDPLTRLAVKRELIRRGKAGKTLPPPVVVLGKDKKKWGWVFPTMRQVMQEGLPDSYSLEALQSIDRELDVYCSGQQWFVTLLMENDSELGPFDDARTALDEAKMWIESQDGTVLSEIPWDEDDLKTHPLKL